MLWATCTGRNVIPKKRNVIPIRLRKIKSSHAYVEAANIVSNYCSNQKWPSYTTHYNIIVLQKFLILPFPVCPGLRYSLYLIAQCVRFSRLVVMFHSHDRCMRACSWTDSNAWTATTARAHHYDDENLAQPAYCPQTTDSPVTLM